jgi:putative membrane protein
MKLRHRIEAPQDIGDGSRLRPRLRWPLVGLTAVALVLSLPASRAQTPQQALVAPAPSTAEFVRQSALNDLFEVTASRMAIERSQTPGVRDFAQQTMSDHDEWSANLKHALKAGSVMLTVPTSLDVPHQESLKDLEAKSGEQFDQAYVKEQIQGHREALDLQRAYAQAGDNAALKQFAGQAAPIVESHLAKLEVLAQETFRGPPVRGTGGDAP